MKIDFFSKCINGMCFHQKYESASHFSKYKKFVRWRGSEQLLIFPRRDGACAVVGANDALLEHTIPQCIQTDYIDRTEYCMCYI